MKHRLVICHLSILSALLCFTSGCGPSLPGGRDPRDLNRLLKEEGAAVLDGWSFTLFTSAQRRALGDETSLAAALLLRDSGREREARTVLRRIVREAEEPWRREAVWELSSLLEARTEWEELEFLLLGEPGLSDEPDLTERLYRALVAQGKWEVLEGCLAARDEERPLLSAAAAVIGGKAGTEEGLIEERLITAAGAKPADKTYDWLWGVIEPRGGKGRGFRLIEAKAALFRGEVQFAAEEMLSLTENPGELTPALVEDLLTIYRKTGQLMEGAVILENFARRNLEGEGGAGKTGGGTFAFGAGRLYRWAGDGEKATECFRLALENASPGERERALWYLLDSLLGGEPLEAPEILSVYAPLWEDPQYHEDTLDRLFSRLLALGAGEAVLKVAALTERYGSRHSRAQGAYLSARIQELGWTPETDPDEVKRLYRMALELDSTGVYGWYSRSRLDEWGSLPGMSSASPSGDLSPDLPLTLYLDLSLLERAQERWGRLNGTGTPGDKRVVTARLQGVGRYLESLRFLGGVGVGDPREAWELRFPRGYGDLIEETAEKYDLPVPLLFSLVRGESGFTAEIESWAGAVGLAQLMPATARDVASRMERPLGVLTDPRENLELGGWYLRWLIGYVGSPWSAVLAYNGGPGRVRGWLKGWTHLPPDLAIEAVPIAETRNYGRNLLVSALYYGYLYYDLFPGEMMELYFDGPLEPAS